MKCKVKHPHCQPTYLNKAGKDYICLGITSKPHHYKHDRVVLCLKGSKAIPLRLEMTPYEAMLIAQTIIRYFINYERIQS